MSHGPGRGVGQQLAALLGAARADGRSAEDLVIHQIRTAETVGRVPAAERLPLQPREGA